MDIGNRFSEVFEILKHLTEEDFNRIPREIIEIIDKNRNKQYIWSMDESKKIYEQELNEDTINILAYINLEFLVNDEQREYLKKLYSYNERFNKLEN